MARTKTVQMPAGIRNKLMASIAMLLVSSIMMVSTTYAWFTLSTAPEVTGITTSVGANGNLEMALLTTEYFSNTDKISSAVGDSSAKAKLVDANKTWGNLVDLSDASYGLNLIALQPAALNATRDADTGLLTSKLGTNLLATPIYGKDGRVAEKANNTISGVYQGSKFVQEQTITATGAAEGTTYDQSYGVRVVGVSSGMSDEEIILNAAKAAYRSSANNAASATANAVDANSELFLNLALALAGIETSESNDYTSQQLDALTEVAKGVQTSLNTIVNAYANAILAAAAAGGTAGDALGTLQSSLTGATDASELKTALETAGVSSEYSSVLTELATKQTSVKNVIEALDSYVGSDEATDGKTATTKDVVQSGAVTPLMGGQDKVTAFDKDGTSIELVKANALKIMAGTIYVGGGLIGDIAAYTGPYVLTTDGANVNAGTKGATGSLATVTNKVNGLSINTDTEEGSSSAAKETVISDYYGYIIDFAFRTNAASSYLQLQTEAVNRVYQGEQGVTDATQGSGSTATFTYGQGLTSAQAKTLLESVKLVFLNPDDGTVYAEAKLDEIATNATENATASTAKIVLDKQYVTLPVGTTNTTAILGLPQNQATKVSVLVYLDGDKVDNTAVLATAASSGTLDLNLQFSSSADLVPMSNSALKALSPTYTKAAEQNADYTFQGKAYTVNAGYTIYTSDGAVYYAANVTGEGATPTYVKLTMANASVALTAKDTTPATPTTYTVKFVLGEGATGTMADATSTTAEYTLPTSLPEEVTAPSDKELDGWSLTDGGTKIEGATTTLTNETTTLYAVWKNTTP